jgi:ABC-type polysaccharide/polyol phosphate export permease
MHRPLRGERLANRALEHEAREEGAGWGVFFLPSMLLSGFMSPFAAMPVPAQRIAQCPPLTHVLRIVRAILLKGARIGDLAGEVAALVVAVETFRKRLV